MVTSKTRAPEWEAKQCAPHEKEKIATPSSFGTYERDIDLWTSRSCPDMMNSPALINTRTIDLENLLITFS